MKPLQDDSPCLSTLVEESGRGPLNLDDTKIGRGARWPDRGCGAPRLGEIDACHQGIVEAHGQSALICANLWMPLLRLARSMRESTDQRRSSQIRSSRYFTGDSVLGTVRPTSSSPYTSAAGGTPSQQLAQAILVEHPDSSRQCRSCCTALCAPRILPRKSSHPDGVIHSTSVVAADRASTRASSATTA
jgi:hypothetical protein